MGSRIEVPRLSLVVLLGPSGSGKSAFARRCFAPGEVISLRRCMQVVADGELGEEIEADAAELMRLAADKRLAHGRLAVVDAPLLTTRERQPLRVIAKRRHVPTVVVAFDPGEEAGAAPDQPAPASGLPSGVRTSQASLDPQGRARLTRALQKLREEGFRRVHVLVGRRAIDEAAVVRTPMPGERTWDEGPFDLIGDVHGCASELEALLSELGYERDEADAHRHPEGRTVVFLGDLVDRGPRIADALRIAMAMVARGRALCVQGNHEAKLERWLRGKRVSPSHGLAASAEQLGREPASFREAVQRFIAERPSHYVLDRGRLVVAHAGLTEHLQGRTGGKVRAFCLYGDTTGQSDELGRPVRLDWAQRYAGEAAVVYGHTPVEEPTWVNGTICIDTGCVFGGRLTALRWPERELVAVEAERRYFEAAVHAAGDAEAEDEDEEDSTGRAPA